MSLPDAKAFDIRSNLRERLVPQLRLRGFRGSFPHFRRKSEKQMELLTFQFDLSGSGRFVIELAKCPLDGAVLKWGPRVPPNKVTAHDLDRRLRLGAATEGDDHWFSPESFHANPLAAANALFQLLETQGVAWWRDA